ncbi:uncharacterized protein ASCRUDRAFT_75715 [Ascoidea rubescens DSM 1968]|uniref:Uncharacterized protein n=1 Tax=Ascoidea rubescens DSM 1968 TaxID=1344418 RepID=A0A1D2VHJ9_9ASCO|nr:hypothetical protein ASCRUDRAFT_75715 [Ascoidea rubescens DSM 1968]ODV60957.1 hypothetical protein ASCRUDRAFT_75715 [Ascoidea rubescens DSM 1968]
MPNLGNFWVQKRGLRCWLFFSEKAWDFNSECFFRVYLICIGFLSGRPGFPTSYLKLRNRFK